MSSDDESQSGKDESKSEIEIAAPNNVDTNAN